jgi:hypothetical protein
MRPLDGESATQFLLMGHRRLRLTGMVEDDLMSVSVDHLRVCDTCSLFYYLLSSSFLLDHDNGYPLSIRAFTGTCVCLAFGDVTMQCFEYQKSATQLYCL